MENRTIEAYPSYEVNTGGGCMVRIVESGDKFIAISDEYIGVYASMDDFYEDEGDKAIKGIWL